MEAMAGAWCATCCPSSVLPALSLIATCKRALRFSSFTTHSSTDLRRQSSRSSSSRRTEVQCCCSSTSRSESCSDSGCLDLHLASRRELLLLVSGVAATAAALPSYAVEEVGPAAPDTTITDRVYLDLMECPNLARSDRTLGNTSLICTDGEDMGRIVIGLYGKQVPQTVKNFKAMCIGAAGSSYEGTIFNRVLQGQYIQAGRQGPRDKGETSPPTKLDRNEEVVRGNSFKLRHQRPGTVSLCLSENDDDEGIKLNSDYRNVEFMITTGPGPAPQLDNGNIVFGTVLEGMEVVAALSTVATYKPSGRIQQFNSFAQLLGDDRAASARANWDKPLKYYTTPKVSSKSDVFSFGVVLLELLTGRLLIDHSAAMEKHPNISNWLRESLQNSDIDSILDPAVKASNPNMEAVWKVAEVAMRSVEPKGMNRSAMSEVVQESPWHTCMPSGYSDYSSGSQYAPTSYPAPR